MNIALIPFLNKSQPERIPPVGYGSVNRVIFHLSEELVRRGHDVTLFGLEGTQSSARVIEVMPDIDTSSGSKEDLDLRNGLKYSANVRIIDALEQESFDIVHSHDLPKIALMARGRGWPLLLRIHSLPNTTYYQHVFRAVGREYPFHFVSANHERLGKEAGCAWSVGHVYHGVETERFPVGDGRGEYVLFVGRIHPTKGVLESVQAARQAGMRIVLAGPIQSHAYFEKLQVDGDQVQYVGEVEWEQKTELYKNAAAYVHTALWQEPFGLTMAEALACGTPVVGFRRGSVPELVEDGVTGFVVDTVDEAAAAIRKIDTIDRAACRERAERLFSIEAMGSRYERVYERLVPRFAERWAQKTSGRALVY